MFKDFQRFVSANKLFQPSDKLLLAISGGVDSVVLSHLLFRYNVNFALAHCDFQLRVNSEFESQIIRLLAENYQIPFFFKKFDTQNFAKQQNISIQMAARQLRYDWFENLIQEYNYRSILTAHQLDDQIETLIFNITKGTGIAGLKGIPVVRHNIRRPLLFATKNQIYHYARKHNLKWHEDESNLENKYKRNLIRNKIVPLLKTINPNLEQTTLQTIEKLDFANHLFKANLKTIVAELIEPKEDAYHIEIEKLKQYNYGSQLLYYLFKPYHFNESQCRQIYDLMFDGQTGKQLFSSTHKILKDRTHFIIHKISNTPDQTFLISNKLTELKIYEPYYFKFNCQVYNQNFYISTKQHIANLDYEQLKFPLRLRKWRAGDWFIPLGMKGKKKLSDFLIDEKYSCHQKERTWVLESQGRIIWVVNRRIDERFKLKPKTKQVFQIELIKSIKK